MSHEFINVFTRLLYYFQLTRRGKTPEFPERVPTYEEHFPDSHFSGVITSLNKDRIISLNLIVIEMNRTFFEEHTLTEAQFLELQERARILIYGH